MAPLSVWICFHLVPSILDCEYLYNFKLIALEELYEEPF